MPNKLEELQSELKALELEWDEYDKKTRIISKKCRKLRNQINTILSDKQFGKELSIEKILNSNWDSVSTEYYHKIDKWWHENFKYVYLGGMMVWNANKKSVKTAFRRSEPIEPQIEQLKQALEHLPWTTIEQLKNSEYGLEYSMCQKDGETKFKYVDIFEHNLSAGGVSYHLEVYPDESAMVVCNYRENFSGSLDECLRYIHKHLYYE